MPTASDLEHAPDCNGAALVRRDSPRRTNYICASCGALLAVPRRTDWAEPKEDDR